MIKHNFWSIVSAIILLTCFAGCSSQVRQTVDLASDTAWELSVDDGPWRSIKVPGGGYNSDLQDQPLIDQENVKDHITYKRSLDIPEFENGNVLKISFGAVNHGCDVYLDDQNVGGHVGPMIPFDVDITDYVESGQEYELKVVSYPQWQQ